MRYDLYDREGRLRLELTGFVDLTSEQKAIVDQAKTILKKRFESDSDFSLTGIDYTLIDNSYYIFLNIKGNQVFSANMVGDLERFVTEKTGQPVLLHVISSIETLATSKGFESYDTFSRRIFEKLKPKLKGDIKKIIENSNL